MKPSKESEKPEVRSARGFIVPEVRTMLVTAFGNDPITTGGAIKFTWAISVSCSTA